MKVNQRCYALFVNVTSGYISFKITKGRYLGKIEHRLSNVSCMFEDEFDSVDYLSEEDIFLTENDAIKALIKMLSEKVKKGNNGFYDVPVEE